VLGVGLLGAVVLYAFQQGFWVGAVETLIQTQVEQALRALRRAHA
jgi:hypothetical protein